MPDNGATLRLTASHAPLHHDPPAPEHLVSPEPRARFLLVSSIPTLVRITADLLFLYRVPLVFLVDITITASPTRKVVMSMVSVDVGCMCGRSPLCSADSRSRPALAPAVWTARNVASSTSTSRYPSLRRATPLFRYQTGLQSVLFGFDCSIAWFTRGRADVTCSSTTRMHHLSLSVSKCSQREIRRRTLSPDASLCPISLPRSSPPLTSGSTPRLGDLTRFPAPPLPVDTFWRSARSIMQQS